MKKNSLPPDLQVMLPSLGLLLVLILSVYVIYNFGLSALFAQRDKLTQVNKDHSALSQKQQLLTSLGQNILPEADASLVAVPSQNPSLLVVSQIKSLAVKNTVAVRSLNVGSPTAIGDLNSVEVNLTIEGQISGILNFVNSLNTLAPLVFLNGMKLSNTGQLTDANISIITYWSDLPQKITSLTAPLTGLTDSETKILGKFSGLVMPTEVQLAPAQPVTRDNPFN